ncbi:MAG: hypothetical protein SNF68_01775 [Rikenellaceae bacterium]
MKNIKTKILLLATLILIAVGSSMAMMVTMSRVSSQVKVLGIDKIEIKGLSGVQITVEIENSSKYDLTMSDAFADLKVNGDKIATMRQVDPATSHSQKRESIVTLWRLDDINPMSLLMLSSQIAKNDFSSLTMDYESVIQAGRYTHNFSDEEVEISKFLTMFQQDSSKL